MSFIGCLQLGPALAQNDKREDALKQERFKVLRERAIINAYGDALFHHIGNSGLPEDLSYPKGVLSLIADPKARGGGRIAVYIINASGKPVPGLDYELTHVWQEVRDGETWKRTEALGLGCGTVAPPKALAAGHTLIRTATDPAIGDVEGDLRYCLSVPGGRPIASQVIRGKFSSQAYEEAAYGSNHLEHSIWIDFRNGVRLNSWEGCILARNHEEMAACVELMRVYDESSSLRGAIRDWLQESRGKTKGQHGELEVFEASLRRSLASPWEHAADEHRFFVHCLGLLSADNTSAKEYGTRGNCRAVVWRCLGNWQQSSFTQVNPERFDQLAACAVMGNPWRADTKEMSSMIEMAEADIRSNDPAIRDAAGRFLTGKWISAGLYDNERYRKLLTIDSCVARRTALLGLAGRNLRSEAIEWLGIHYETLGTELIWVWNTLWHRDDPLAHWEIPIAKHLPQHDPLHAFFQLNSRYMLGGPSPKWELPVELREPVREYLIRESRERKVVGQKLPTRDSEGVTARYEPETFHPQYLAEGLTILAHWKIPEDTDVLRSFLDHPAAGYSRHDKVTENKFYTVRERALALLKARRETTPENLVLREQIRARDLPPP
jgi:hypothetical protein